MSDKNVFNLLGKREIERSESGASEETILHAHPAEPETSDIDGDLQGAPVLANQSVETFDWNEHWGSVDESKFLGIVPHWTPESPYPDKIVWVPSNSTTSPKKFANIPLYRGIIKVGGETLLIRLEATDRKIYYAPWEGLKVRIAWLKDTPVIKNAPKTIAQMETPLTPEQCVTNALEILEGDLGPHRHFSIFDQDGKAIPRGKNPFQGSVSSSSRSYARDPLRPVVGLCLSYFNAILAALPSFTRTGGFGWDFPKFIGWDAKKTLTGWSGKITLYFEALSPTLLSETDLVSKAEKVAGGRRLRFKCLGKTKVPQGTHVVELSTHFLSIYRIWITENDRIALLKFQSVFPFDDDKSTHRDAGIAREAAGGEEHMLDDLGVPLAALVYPTSDCVKAAHSELVKKLTGKQNKAGSNADTSKKSLDCYTYALGVNTDSTTNLQGALDKDDRKSPPYIPAIEIASLLWSDIAAVAPYMTFEWLHRSANVFGKLQVGGKAIGACDPENFVFGTRAANMLMLRYENTIGRVFEFDTKLRGQLVTRIQLASDVHSASPNFGPGTDIAIAWGERYRWFCPNLHYNLQLIKHDHDAKYNAFSRSAYDINPFLLLRPLQLEFSLDSDIERTIFRRSDQLK